MEKVSSWIFVGLVFLIANVIITGIVLGIFVALTFLPLYVVVPIFFFISCLLTLWYLIENW